TINVSGLSGNINSLKVTLTNLSHTWPDDIDVLLVGPTGTKALLMSDVGGSGGVNNVTLTFDPTATSSLPDSGPITSGSYKATDFETGDIFNSPAPGGPYGTDFSVFNGINPNGTWSLYVVDDAGGDAGTIAGGWSLLIGTGTATPVVTVVATDAVAGEPANNGQYTLTRTGDTASDLTVNIAMSGTATNGVDYTTIPATVTFKSGFSTATVDLNVIDDTLQEGTETATLTVLGGSGYTPGSLGNKSGSATASQGNITPSSSATVSIADDEPPLNTITLNAADTGWYDSTGFHGPTNTNYFAGDHDTSATLYRNWYAFNLPTLTAPIVSAQLRVKTFDYNSLDASETYQLQEVTTAVPTLTAGGSGKTTIYADLGDGAIYGSRVYTNADDNQFRTIDLNAAAISALTAKSGQAFALGGLLTTLDTIDNIEYIFGFSNDGLLSNAQLILNTGTALPVVSLASNYSGVSENGKTNLVYNFTRSGATTNSLTVNFTLSGTATRGNDYNAYGGNFVSPTTGNIVFAPGQTTAQIEIVTTGDTVREANETIAFTLASGTGYTIGTPGAVTTTILNDDGVLNQQGTTGNDVIEAGTTRNLSGRAGHDILIGSNASDMLVGAAGNDTITSGAGFDVIAYSLASEGQDTITDFNVFQDTLQVSAAGFGGGLIAGESIAAAQFVLGTVATTASHRFIFNKPTGQLFFDVDGNGSSVQTLLATLTPNLNLTEDNIFAA
ncbi:MAG: subtilase, partial [Microcystis panniformis Mp_MB_F_20051200_S6D]